LTSSGPGFYHLTIRKIYFRKMYLNQCIRRLLKLNKQHVFQLGQILLTSKNLV
jgi:hypothetical protein